MIYIRPIEVFDEPLLPRFLSLVAHEEDVEVVLSNPALAIYVERWGCSGDCGIVAEDGETGTIVGIAWARFWTADQHGFGWIDELTPELAVAVELGFQGQGIGGRLIEALKRQLRVVASSVALNVREGSPAIRLYERAGFEKVEGSERQNRTGGVSFNMVAPLQSKLTTSFE